MQTPTESPAPPAPRTHSRDTGWRKDIQLLRAIAVLFVVVYHAELDILPGGYLGVDVFFVVSGFLMTRILLTELWDTNRIRLFPFFLRRARRLLPAASFTCLWTGLLSVLIYTQDRFVELGKFMFGALFFISNIVFYVAEKDYFATEQNANPFLHFWSLSVEEQFYFIFPIFLIIARKYVVAAIVIAAIASYLACAYMMAQDPGAAFYLLPFRAWELLLGSLVFVAVYKRPIVVPPSLRSAVALAGLVVIAGFGVLPIDSPHPGFPALGVTLATAAVLFAQPPWRMDHAATRWTTSVGNWSYSIYLVHWPLFAFASELYIGLIPIEVAIALCVASVGLGFLQYRYVEQVFRTKDMNLKAWFTGAALLGLPALGAVALALVGPRLPPPYPEGSFKFARGLAPPCWKRETLDLLPECQTAADANVLVWGDSFAAHLLPGLAAVPNARIIDATRGLCGPMPGIRFSVPGGQPSPSSAFECASFNASVMEELARNEAIEVVALSSPLNYYFKPAALFEGFAQTNDRMADITAILSQTVASIREAGKRVVFVAPPPVYELDVGRCLKRQVAGKPILVDSCNIPQKAYKEYRADVLELIDRLSKEADVEIIWMSDSLCDGAICRTSLDGTPIYFDNGHFSVTGSRLVIKHTGLYEAILAKAR